MSEILQLLLYVVGWLVASIMVYWVFDVIKLKKPGLLPFLVALVLIIALANRWSPNLIERIVSEMFPVFAKFMYDN